MPRVLVLLLSSLLLAACAVSGPPFSEAPPPPSGKALLYVYRPYHFGGAGRDAKVFVDGKLAADLPAGGYTYLYLAAGKHHVTQQWHDWSILDDSEMKQALGVTLKVAEGDTRYVCFEASTGPGRTNDEYMFEWVLSTPLTLTARQEIEQLKFIGVAK